MTARAALVLTSALFAGPARASDGGADAPAMRRPPPLPRFAVELRLGAYRPNLDDGLRTPVYEPTFGDGRRFMLSAEFDWQPLHLGNIASIGVGGIVGYTKASAPAPFKTRDEASGEDTYFKQWMFAVVGVARLEVLARTTVVPLVPYGKLGTWVGLWSSGNGLGESTSADGTAAHGRTHGILWAGGLALEMDFLDRHSAKNFSVEHGVEHSWIFAEYTAWDGAGLLQSKALNVGARAWNFGVGFMF